MAGFTKTIGLAFIAKDQEGADQLIKKYGKYFDDVFYRVGLIDEKTSFADARNEVLEKTTTDFWFWCDLDDELVGLDNLRPLVQHMVDNKLDAVYLPYEYAYNDLGECIVLQWRERILRTKHPFRWLGAVHESAISEGTPVLDRSEEIIIKHSKTADEHNESAIRNHSILLREYEKEERDPRITHYLAMSFFNLKDYQKAIQLFLEHIETSGWDEDKYRSWFYVGQAFGLLGDQKNVLNAASEGIKLLPNRPECYVVAATAEFEMGNFGKALEWLRNSSIKNPPKDSLSAIDPTYYSYRAEYVAALCYLNLGQIKEGYAQIQSVLQKSPNFQQAKDVYPLFQGEYGRLLAVERIGWLTEYLQAYGGAPAKVFEALPPELFTDVRLNRYRNAVIKPRVWSDNSIVFFCGESAEAWGPDTLDKGMGGSEEAIVYLSRELAGLGYEVTVFCERDDEYTDKIGGVQYMPWTAMNPNDEFHTFVVWRRPTLFSAFPINAKVKLVDLHDSPVGHTSIGEQAVATTDKFMFKSKFQRDIANHIPDEKTAIVPNGLVPEHFDVEVERNPKKVIYASTHERGLDALLDMWPAIKEQVPDAELHTYYGWNTFDAFHKNNPERMKWKLNMIRKMYKNKAIDHGRISHEELAKEFKSAGVWFYPTMFAEIDCITAAKAGAAGNDVISSGYAALQTKQLHGYKLPGNDQMDPLDTYKNPENQKKLVDAVVEALNNPLPEDKRKKFAEKYIAEYNWKKIAKGWQEAIDEVRTRHSSISGS